PLNGCTLGGPALGVGRLVDDSILELENIHRHLAMGQGRWQAVLAAAQEVAMPILVSTITTIVVFFPVLFLFGIARNLFLPLALTIAFALIMSFFVSRTVTPLLCLQILRAEHAHDRTGVAGWIVRRLEGMDDAYARALRWVLGHRALTVCGILAFFVLSLGIKRFIGTEFFPDTDESQFTLLYKTPIGTRVERTEQVATRLEDAVSKTLSPNPTTMPIDVEILGYDLEAGSRYAAQVSARMRQLTGGNGRPLLTDVQISREENYPELDVVVDREKAGTLGLSETQVAQSVLATLSGSTQFAPTP